MKIIINNIEHTLPTSLSEITLGQRIGFQREHGDMLDEMQKSILDMPDGLAKTLEIEEFHYEKMFRTFAFFTNTTPEALKESEFIDQIANIYFSSLKVLFEDEDSLQLKSEFAWKGEFWYLAAPELKHGDKIQFGELIDAKQTIKDMDELGHNKWERMVPLCAIYLRKAAEEYDQSFLYEDSDRRKLMLDLSMDIVLQVGFFLTSILNIYMNTSQSSSLLELKSLVNTPGNTLQGLAGSTS